MSNYCRTCGKFIYCLITQNLFEQEDSIMLHQIEALTGLSLHQHGNWPVNICGVCVVSLREAIGFRERIIKTQQILQSHSNVAEALKQIDLEDAIRLSVGWDNDEDIDEELNDEDEEEEAYDSHGYGEEEYCDDDETADEDTAESQVTEPMQEVAEELPIKEEEPATVGQTNAVPRNRKRVSTVYASVSFADNTKQMPRTDWSKLTEEEIVALKRERRKRDCICEQCGRHFSCPSNFKVHLLRHAGIKNYTCKVCSAKFYTAHLLRRHEILHVCNKPYQCQYCDHRFTHYSGRIQHERNRHTNYKPYKCSECDKAFAVSGKLKTHMIRHTGVRAFQCEVCNQSFMRKTHLAAHFRSKGHKQNTAKPEPEGLSTKVEITDASS